MRLEGVELVSELDQCAGGGPGRQPALQGLVEALDLALGLGVAGGSVLLTVPEDGQEVFERVACAGDVAGVDAAVIGQRLGGRPWRSTI
jgi:hypothetical protein